MVVMVVLGERNKSGVKPLLPFRTDVVGKERA